jgi:hypothetical protein
MCPKGTKVRKIRSALEPELEGCDTNGEGAVWYALLNMGGSQNGKRPKVVM